MMWRLGCWCAFVLVLSGCLAGPERPRAESDGQDDPVGHGPVVWPELDDAWLRPGDKLFPEDVGTSDGVTAQTCTVNFVFVSEGNLSVFVGAAAHCLTDMTVGETMTLAGRVDATLVYCSWGAVDGEERCTDKAAAGLLANRDEDGFPNDFALFRIHPEHAMHVHPALRHWGGPTGMAIDPQPHERVLTYGNSFVRDAGRPDLDMHDAREGYVRASEEWTTYVLLFTPPLPGDSGSPVLLADGSAIGVVQTSGTQGAGVVNLRPALDHYNEQADMPLRLATWDLLTDPILPPVPAGFP